MSWYVTRTAQVEHALGEALGGHFAVPLFHLDANASVAEVAGSDKGGAGPHERVQHGQAFAWYDPQQCCNRSTGFCVTCSRSPWPTVGTLMSADG